MRVGIKRKKNDKRGERNRKTNYKMIYTLYINISKVWALSFKIDLETGDECNVCTVFVM